jgi:MFS family permease
MRPLRPIFFGSFFFSFHFALLSYLNSTAIAQHASPIQTTLIYTASSTLSLILIVIAPRIVRRIGASAFLICALTISAILLWILGTQTEHGGFLTAFVLYFSLNTVVWYAFDLVIEHYSREQVTGNIRGVYLTINNTAWVLAPITASTIALYAGFSGTYAIASVCVLISLLVIRVTPRIELHHHVPKISLFEAFKALTAHAQARRIVTLYFVIQFFFAWMVLYMAPYLLHSGFSWSTIGWIFGAMLLPFVLFQYMAGKIADRFHAERTLIIVGFGIAALSTCALAFPLPPIALVFAGTLFMTRVGASIIEVGCESAFFKEVSEKDTALIGTLRMAVPLAFIIAPLLGALVFSFGSTQLLYGILAGILFIAMLYAFRLKK